MAVAIISFVAAAASVVLGVLACRTAPSPTLRTSGIVWGAVLTALQVFIGVWSALGLVQNDILAATIAQLVITMCAVAAFARPHIHQRLSALTSPEGRFSHPMILTIILLVVGAVLASLGLEVSSNHNLLWMYPLCLLLEVALVGAVAAGLFFLFQRRGGVAAGFSLVLYIIGLAEYFVITFKSMPIQPGDLSALSTAAAVAGTGYTYSLSSFCLYSLAISAVAMSAYLAAGALRPEKPARSRAGLVRNLIIGLVCIAGVACHVTLVDYYNTLNIQVYTWRPLESYYRQGFIPTFISSAQTIVPPKPEGYDADEAQDLIDEYAATYDETTGSSEARTQATAQFDEEKPTVITIMNETFSDLSIYQMLHADYTGPTYFNSISDAVASGRLFVSAYGGGTANTEFEYLTGNSMAYLGQGVYPYTIYNLTQTENLASQFKELGYSTYAMHPNHGTNWNRENVYRDFGFDEFYTIEDFQDADKLRGMVTDEATYDKILELLEQDENPQFIFDVTMQNHSGYDTGLLPASMQEDYRIDGIYDSEVNEYLALIKESDRALEQFISQLKKLDRKVILVFFGDHQPFFPSQFNDAWFQNESEATHAERLWQTKYVIWANYDLAGSSQTSETQDVSSNFLGALMMDLIGAPLTDYQKAQLALRSEMPAINATGYEDKDGTWYLTGTSGDGLSAAGVAATEARRNLSKMQYLMLFGHGDGIFTKTLQSAANETDPNLAPGTTKIK